MQAEDKWYWSLTRHQVVRGGEEREDEVLGPYATRDEAEGALDRVKARNDALVAQERRELEERLADATPEERERRLAEFDEKQRFGGSFGF